jgi:toxin ParE1/3/4
MRARYRPQFLCDVEEEAEYLAREAGEDVALRWRDAVKEAIRLICQQPYIGRTRPDLPFPNVRSLILRDFDKYIVFYRVEDRFLDFVRVKHGMMDLPSLFEPEPSN